MPVEEIKQMFNQLIVGKLNVSEGAVLPISALNGCVAILHCCASQTDKGWDGARDGIREAVNWLFLRVQKFVRSFPGNVCRTEFVLDEQFAEESAREMRRSECWGFCCILSVAFLFLLP